MGIRPTGVRHIEPTPPWSNRRTGEQALRYGADLTAKQIAELLGQRTNAVEVALHRALGRLRTELEAPAVDPEPAGKPLPTTGNS